MAKMNETQERTWGLIAHLSALAGFIVPFGHIIGPLVIWLIKKDESPFVDDQGKESINFQISMTLYAVVAAVLVLVVIGIFLLIGIGILDVVLVIVAAVKANAGEKFRYPLTIRFIR
ncbi:MAG: DUF4870 domain-containing protein [Candidatus Aminicenantes bacterium]|nr:DUF4870 domain-containing protein [Candidatus Aminicenantes bacterium]